MSCYHPYIGFKTGQLTDEGKPLYKLRPADKSRNPLIELKENDSVLIPCGKCIGCRLDKARSWSDRMMLELETMKTAIFVTLTYDDDHIPRLFDDAGTFVFYTLDKRDCQLFMKDLRSHFEDKRLRFYLSGEYGEHTLRPHYHAILYGLSLEDFPDNHLFGYNELGQKYYVSEKLAKIWKRGHVMFSEVSYETCAYVARYCQKKLSNDFVGDEWYMLLELGLQPEFSLMSRRPGIGREYLDLHPDALDFQYINISTEKEGRKIAIPKYYLRQLELTDSEKYAKLMEKRKKYASDKMLLELSGDNIGLSEYLSRKERDLEDHIKVLKRQSI